MGRFDRAGRTKTRALVMRPLSLTMAAKMPVRKEKRSVGTLQAACRVENVVDRRKSAKLANVPVDTGSEFTWVPGEVLERIGVKRERKDPRFVMADGQQISQRVGF